MPGKTVTVSTASQLFAAARAAKAGDTILLAPGHFGDVVLSNINPSGPITIKSADPNNDAVMRSLRIGNVSNIIFNDFDVSRPLAAGANTNDGAIQFNSGKNVTFIGIDVRGSMDNNAINDGHGIVIASGNNISILDSTFQQLRTAVIVRGDSFLFAGNTVTQVQEGVQISSMNKGVFEQNYMANWQGNYAAGAHPDMFQVGTATNGTVSSNLIFRDNVMLPGSDPVGGILISGGSKRLDNILVENNYYEGAYRHGITVVAADDVIIRNNTVVMGNNQGLVPAINISAVNRGLVTNNVSTMLLENKAMPNTGVTIRDNVDVWDTHSKKGVAIADLFAAADKSNGEIDFTNFDIVSSSPVARAGAGFVAVGEIGDLSGSVSAQIAAWLPTYDHNFAVFH